MSYGYYDSDSDDDFYFDTPKQCGSCNATLEDQQALEQHHRAYHRFECETCTRVFSTQNGCDQHMTALGHWAVRYNCETCTRQFLSERAAQQHMSAVGHWALRFSCQTCNLQFRSSEMANQHMRQEGHYRNYCKSCQRQFNSENNLQMVSDAPFPSLPTKAESIPYSI
jgi:hypothetical protein